MLVSLCSSPNTCYYPFLNPHCVIKRKLEVSLVLLIEHVQETLLSKGQHLIQGIVPFVQEMHLVSGGYRPLLTATMKSTLHIKTIEKYFSNYNVEKSTNFSLSLLFFLGNTVCS